MCCGFDLGFGLRVQGSIVSNSGQKFSLNPVGFGVKAP